MSHHMKHKSMGVSPRTLTASPKMFSIGASALTPKRASIRSKNE